MWQPPSSAATKPGSGYARMTMRCDVSLCDRCSLLARARRHRKRIARRLHVAGRARIVAGQLRDLRAERRIAQHGLELLHREVREKLVAAEKEIALGDERHEVEAETARRHFEPEARVG